MPNGSPAAIVCGASSASSGLPNASSRNLDAAATLDFLRTPPENRLEALQGDRRGSYGIRDRLCFRFVDGDVSDAEIYH